MYHLRDSFIVVYAVYSKCKRVKENVKCRFHDFYVYLFTALLHLFVLICCLGVLSRSIFLKYLKIP